MIPYIAYGTNTEIGVMRYIDDNRENVGDPKVSSQSVGNVSLALDANNIPYITYKEMLSKRTYISYIMKLMGKNRITVGDSFFHTSVDSIAFDSDNVPYIAYTDDRNDLHPRSVVIKQFIDDTRQTVGNPRFSY